MHRALPEDVKRALYLDYDLLVLRDVSPLWSIDLRSRLGAMVEEPEPVRAQADLGDFARKLNIDFDSSQPYFNTGVIMANLERWAEIDVGELLEARFAKHRPHNCLFDQGEMNLLLGAEFVSIPAKYNVIHAPNYDLAHRVKLNPCALAPIILHFAGSEKVTSRWRRQGEKACFYDILDRTSWKGWRSDNDRSLSGRVIAQLLEYRHLLNNRESLPDFQRLFLLLILSNPTLPLLQLLIVPARKLRDFARGGRDGKDVRFGASHEWRR